MARTVPTSEPLQLRAGDTWDWTRSLGDYPAPTWTLTYTLVSDRYKLIIEAEADGADHAVSVTPATTREVPAGRYAWQAVVTDGSSTYTLSTGRVEVLPDFAAVDATLDTRSHARKVLEAIEAVIEGRATTDQQAVTLAGRSLSRMPIDDLLRFRASYRAEVLREEGATGAQRVLVRF